MPPAIITYPVFRPKQTDMCFCGSGELFGWCCASDSRDRQPPHGIHIARQFLDQGLCKEWTNILESQPRQASGVYDARRSAGTELKATVAPGRTSSKVAPGPLADAFNTTIARAFRHAASVYGREFEWFELPKVLRYGPSNYYGSHADNCHRERNQDYWTKMIDRDVSLLIYLNEEFQGGGLWFEKFNYEYQPRVGDLLLFPSDNRYKHAAKPVESGIRYVLVSWGAFAGEPRVHQQPPGVVVAMAAFGLADQQQA
jgi:predicted 2-oxoglutarate/Fe(II)-dependent dioxygenase YbiX